MFNIILNSIISLMFGYDSLWNMFPHCAKINWISYTHVGEGYLLGWIWHQSLIQY